MEDTIASRNEKIEWHSDRIEQLFWWCSELVPSVTSSEYNCRKMSSRPLCCRFFFCTIAGHWIELLRLCWFLQRRMNSAIYQRNWPPRANAIKMTINLVKRSYNFFQKYFHPNKDMEMLMPANCFFFILSFLNYKFYALLSGCGNLMIVSFFPLNSINE